MSETPEPTSLQRQDNTVVWITRLLGSVIIMIVGFVLLPWAASVMNKVLCINLQGFNGRHQ